MTLIARGHDGAWWFFEVVSRRWCWIGLYGAPICTKAGASARDMARALVTAGS